MRILTARWPGLADTKLSKGPCPSLPPPTPPSSLPYSANVKLTARLSALAVRIIELDFFQRREPKV